MSFQVEIKGLKELSEALTQMPVKLAGRALGASVAAGAAVVREAVKSQARLVFKDPTGATEKSIVVYRRRGSSPSNIGYCVGVTMKKKWPRRITNVSFIRRKKTQVGIKQPAYWWKFSEFGTSRQAATPWFRPAWGLSQRNALWMITHMLEKAVALAAEQVPKYSGG